jgi:phospholipid transport system substrate-binding protein
LLKEKPAVGTREDQKLRESVRGIVRGFIDFRELGQRALAANWEKLTPAQRDEFVSVLRQLIERNYVKQIRSNVEYEISYRGETLARGEATVKTTVHTQRRGRTLETDIDYKLVQREGRWLVFDVITDEVSLVRNYRSQFDRIIERESYDGLLRKMKKKLADTADET